MLYFFLKEPHVYLNLSQNPRILACGYDSVIRNIESVIRETTSTQNNGVPRLFCEEPMLVNHEEHFLPRGPDCLYVHATTVLPDSGLMVLVIRPPAKWGWYEKGADGQLILGDDRRPKLKKVELLFRLYDMYLLGFQYRNLWQLFGDINLKGVISGININRYVRKLPFKSSYGHKGMEVDFEKLKIGKPAMFKTYKVLSNNSHYSESDTMTALATLSVTISEGTRLRFFQRRVVKIFDTNKTEVVDKDPENPDSVRIHHWVQDCGQVKKGLLLDGLGIAEADKERKKYNQILRDLGVIKLSED